MSRARHWALCSVFLWCAVALVDPADVRLVAMQTFRSATDLVRVDVSVRQGSRPVTGLALADFDLLDNGVPQRISDLSYEKLPIDVTVALDVSASVEGRTLTELSHAIDQLRSRLTGQDRVRVLSFNARIRRLMNFTDRAVSTQTLLQDVRAGGGTAIFDTIAVALAADAPIDRRQLLILFSDGQDTSSINDAKVLDEVAKRTNATLAFVLATSGFGTAVHPVYDTLATETGGTLIAVSLAGVASSVTAFGGMISQSPVSTADLPSSFGRILDNFRSSYVLHFAPEGISRSGAHTLTVRVTRPGRYDVLARRGYVVN